MIRQKKTCVNKYMKGCSTLLVNKKLQIKTTWHTNYSHSIDKKIKHQMLEEKWSRGSPTSLMEG